MTTKNIFQVLFQTPFVTNGVSVCYIKMEAQYFEKSSYPIIGETFLELVFAIRYGVMIFIDRQHWVHHLVFIEVYGLYAMQLQCSEA